MESCGSSSEEKAGSRDLLCGFESHHHWRHASEGGMSRYCNVGRKSGVNASSL